jgi:predicted helicase
MIRFYNQQVADFAHLSAKGSNEVEGFIERDAKKISWSGNLKADLLKVKKAKFDSKCIRDSYYRPFCRQNLYFYRQFNERVYHIPSIFPHSNTENIAICVTGKGSAVGFSVLMVNATPNFHFHDTGQCFPLHIATNSNEFGMLDFPDSNWHLNVTDYAHTEFQNTYSGKGIGKEDIFFYVYGILHSPEYKQRFAADLKKMLPRIPYAEDFWAFSKGGAEAGRPAPEL